jgi:predicted DNA-binding transcriptional regulator AlpA
MKAKLRTPAAAAYLGLKPNTLEIWRYQKRGPKFYKIGRCVVYDQDDLEAYVAAHGVLTVDTMRQDNLRE